MEIRGVGDESPDAEQIFLNTFREQGQRPWSTKSGSDFERLRMMSVGVKRISPSKDLGWRGILRNLNRFEVSKGFLKHDWLNVSYPEVSQISAVSERGSQFHKGVSQLPNFWASYEACPAVSLPLDMDSVHSVASQRGFILLCGRVWRHHVNLNSSLTAYTCFTKQAQPHAHLLANQQCFFCRHGRFCNFSFEQPLPPQHPTSQPLPN